MENNKKSTGVYSPKTYAFDIKSCNIVNWYADRAKDIDWAKGKVEISHDIALKIEQGKIDRDKLAYALSMGRTVEEFLGGSKSTRRDGELKVINDSDKPNE